MALQCLASAWASKCLGLCRASDILEVCLVWDVCSGNSLFYVVKVKLFGLGGRGFGGEYVLFFAPLLVDPANASQ